MLILLSNNLWAIQMKKYFEREGYYIEITDEGKHVTISKGDRFFSSITNEDIQYYTVTTPDTSSAKMDNGNLSTIPSSSTEM